MSSAVSPIPLQEQIGQLLMVGFDGLVVNQEIESLIRQQRIGGVILFRRNIESPAQVAALCRRLQEINAEVSAIPLLIGIDQEGGMVMRIENGVTPLPSAMAYPIGGSAADCAALHQIGADELRQMGININFAPDLDINNNRQNPVIGVRSFGENVATVNEYGLAAMRGIQAAGVAATAKHFPGHGDTAADSHYGLPLVAQDQARLFEVELAPFRAAIAAGVDAIMTAHVVFPAFEPDPNTPATLSHAVLTGLLRDEMGFDGVVFTDCLEMGAIAAGVGTVAGAVQAIHAGADIVLVSHTVAWQRATVQALQADVQNGSLSVKRLEQSLARIARLKQTAAVQQWQSASIHSLRSAQSLELAAKIQQQAVLGEGRALDAAKSTLLITVEIQTRTEIDEVALGQSQAARGTLLPLLLAAGMAVKEVIISPQATQAEQAAVLAMLADAEQVVLQTYNACLSIGQRDLVASLPAEKLWLIAGRLPYDMDLAPAAAATYAAFGNRPAALAAIAKRLI
ncbi:beta-N-acetylhexosaminidase [Deefgea piscis]|uniref:beta-N-acetylhexosaminidase n=1 Tax=Deefgea piscis TaxID=2739061 RepID=A0A6M8SR48_9NEIS|nr:beta-N-acetylhexosaminidase [Deefgea piscis]QKJ65776.1 beta-N-acetylhexosaminidase [Deefgea piscis]